jgi:hypothetical protein
MYGLLGFFGRSVIIKGINLFKQYGYVELEGELIIIHGKKVQDTVSPINSSGIKSSHSSFS